MKRRGPGVAGDIAVGAIGAQLGGFLLRTLGVHAGGALVGSLVTAFLGAGVLLFVIDPIEKA